MSFETYKSILIVEDEQYQSELLEKYIIELKPNYVVEKCATHVDEVVDFLKNKTPDLIFMDIDLNGSLCFEIFEQVKTIVPVVYCSSHSNYALDTYHNNGIHFLTKPTTKARVSEGISKFEQLEGLFSSESSSLTNLERSKFLLKVGKYTLPIDIDAIQYAHLKDKIVFLKTESGKSYTMDSTLDELTDQLNENFFRLNRQFIVNINMIQKFQSLDGGKIEVILNKEEDNIQLVSFKRRRKFLDWIYNQ